MFAARGYPVGCVLPGATRHVAPSEHTEGTNGVEVLTTLREYRQVTVGALGVALGVKDDESLRFRRWLLVRL